jgi:hypothetical protein
LVDFLRSNDCFFCNQVLSLDDLMAWQEPTLGALKTGPRLVDSMKPLHLHHRFLLVAVLQIAEPPQLH